MGVHASISKRTPLDYFLLMLPAETMHEVISNTNKLFIAKNRRELTPHELLVFVGCLFTISTKGDRVGLRREHWTEPIPGDGMTSHFPGLRLGRWMSVKRFEELLNNIVWGYRDSHPNFDANDLWWPVRQHLDGFNARREEVVRPGVVLCADESGTKWKGREYQGRDDFLDGAPKISVQTRKPEPVHIEVKNLVCAESKIMLRMEIQEGKEAGLPKFERYDKQDFSGSCHWAVTHI